MTNLIQEAPGLFYVDAVWISLVSIAGVIGNSLALCAVATTPSLRTSTQFHLTILAGVDLFITAVLAPCRIATEYYSGRWPSQTHWCHVLAYAVIFFMGYSLLQLLYLALNRYLRVTKSEVIYRRFTSKSFFMSQQVSAVFVTGMLTLLPLYSGFGSVGYHPKSHFCLFTGRNQQVLATVSMVMALGVTPLFYGLTFWHVRSHRRRVDNWKRENMEGTKLPNSGQSVSSRSIQRISTDEVTPKKDRTFINQNTRGVQTRDVNTNSRPISSNSSFNSGKQRERNVCVDHAANLDPTIGGGRIGMLRPVPLSLPAVEASGRGQGSQSIYAPRKIGPTKASIKITRNLLLIFCAYMFCWLPWCILSLMGTREDIPIWVYHVINNMIWTNSCINPYLYAALSGNYGKAFKRCMKFKCFSRDGRSVQQPYRIPL